MNGSRGLRRVDAALLAAAGILACAATLRLHGVAGVKALSVVLLAAGAVLAVAPLARVFGGRQSLEERRKAVLAVILAAHIVGTFFSFAPEDIANSRPVISLDYALHYQQVERAREVFFRAHRLHAYDPWFMAGHPGGTVFDIDSKGVEVWCALLRFVDSARAFKAFVLLAFLLAPLTIYAGCRLMRLRFEESVFAVLLFLVYWHWGRPYAGDFRFAGMFSYLFVSHLSVYVVGLFKAFLDGGALKRFFVVGPLACLVHPTAAVILPVPFLAIFLARRRSGEKEGWRGARCSAGLLALWCLAVLAVNAIWIVPLLRYIDIKIASESFFQISGFGALAAVVGRPGNLPALALVPLGAAGFARMLRDRRFGAAWGFGGMSLFLFFISGFGVRIPLIDQMEPGRFLVPAFIGLAPLAGAGAVWILDAIRGLSGASIMRALKPAAAIALVASVPFCALGESRGARRHTLSTTPIPELAEALDALERFTGPSARLMVEDGPAWAYGDSHYPSIIPLRTGVEQIGGPYPFMFIRHSFASFQTGRGMGKALCDLPVERLSEYLRLYNIRWILTATPDCGRYIGNVPDTRVLWSSRRFVLREVVSWNPEGFAATVPGGEEDGAPRIRVEAEYDAIRVSVVPGTDASAPPPRFILLKYHWDKGLQVASPARISPVFQLDDPVPFILLEPGGEREVLVTYH